MSVKKTNSKVNKCKRCGTPFKAGEWEVLYKGEYYLSRCRDILRAEDEKKMAEELDRFNDIKMSIPQGPTFIEKAINTSDAIKHLTKEGAINTIKFAKETTETTKNIFREAAARSGKYEKIKTEEEAYAIALSELEDKKYVKGLMAKAIAITEGNDKKTDAKYIELRAKQLIDAAEDIKSF